MNSDGVASEIQYRIEADAAAHGGRMPENVAAAWRGYLAALIEWQIVSADDYWRLVHLVPDLDPDPAKAILLGRA